MSGDAWFWLLVVVAVFWVGPIALFFFRPQREVLDLDEWEAAPYESLKFGKGKEILVIAFVCVVTSWLIWACVKAGLLG